MKLVFATNNPNKRYEVQNMLPDSLQILSLQDINCSEDIAETAHTIQGNAKLKADYITEKYNYSCFADDTGLEVNALKGAPGVFSARYAGTPVNTENNIQKLLINLADSTNRSAQFRTVICLNLNEQQFLFEGICEGEIISKKSGTEGFGYDPIFKPKGYKTTFAEMDIALKNKISHRGIAMAKLISFLKTVKI